MEIEIYRCECGQEGAYIVLPQISPSGSRKLKPLDTDFYKHVRKGCGPLECIASYWEEEREDKNCMNASC